jgi:hypothetical protein
MKNTWRIKKQDWIILRLLFIMMAIDPKIVGLRDVKKSLEYLRGRYKYWSQDIVFEGYAPLIQEHSKLQTFVNEPEIDSIRKMMDSVKVHYNFKDEEEAYEAGRRYFGTTYGTQPNYSTESLIRTLADLEGKKK